MPGLWKKSLELGLREIDEQHREYFRRADALMDACLQHTSPEETVRMLEFLRQYAAVHFSSEEALMTTGGYPESDAQVHRSQHQWFSREISALVENAQREGKPPSAVKLTSLVVDWFQHHIQRLDRKLVTALLATRAAPRGLR